MSTPSGAGDRRAVPAPPLPPRGPGLRRRLLAAGALLLPILELAVLIQVGSRIGLGATLLLLLAGAVAGTLVLRRVGSEAIRRVGGASARAGGDPAAPPVPPVAVPPARPPAETALVVVAGVLLLVPGFLSDAAALVLLVPPVRRALVRRAGEVVLRRFRVRQVRVVQGQVVEGGVYGPGPQLDVRVIQSRPPGPPSAH